MKLEEKLNTSGGLAAAISSKRALKQLVGLDNRPRALAWLTGFFVLTYGIPNHYPIKPPQLLEIGWIDSLVGFMPATVWIYISAYALIYLSFFLTDDLVALNRTVYAYLIITSLSAVAFVFYPTTFARQAYPLPTDLDPITGFAFDHLRILDTPGNCFPSLHVGLSFLCTFLLYPKHPKKFFVFLIWSCAIWFSTLSTKQHYFMDGVAGLCLTLIVDAFLRQKTEIALPGLMTSAQRSNAVGASEPVGRSN
jgi:hypothetical protein